MATRKPENQDPVQRRINAARILAGMSWEALAEHIHETGYSASTLRRIDEDSPKRVAVFRRISEATGLPVTFFTAALADLGPSAATTSSDDVADLRATVATLQEQMGQVQAHLAVLDAEGQQQTAGSSPTTTDLQQGPRP